MYVQQTIAPSDTDDDGICTSQTPLGAGNLTLNGALVSGGVAIFGAQQFVTIACAGSDAARIFTIYTVGQTGQTGSFTLAGSSGSTTTATIGALKVTRVAVDAATAGAIKVGIVGQGRQYPIAVDLDQNPTTINVSVDVTGTINYSVQHTYNILSIGNPDTWTWFNCADAAVVSKAVDAFAAYTSPPTAIAILINSVTAPGQVVFRVIQAATAPG